MKKLVLKFLLLILPIIIFIFLINARYVSTNHWKAENNVWKFNFVPDDIQLANFGSSHGEYGFFYDDFSQYKTFNFAVNSQRYFGITVFCNNILTPLHRMQWCFCQFLILVLLVGLKIMTICVHVIIDSLKKSILMNGVF